MCSCVATLIGAINTVHAMSCTVRIVSEIFTLLSAYMYLVLLRGLLLRESPSVELLLECVMKTIFVENDDQGVVESLSGSTQWPIGGARLNALRSSVRSL